MKDITKIKSYIINLEKHKEKYNRALKNLSKIDIYPERFNAIYIADSNTPYIKSITDASVQYNIIHGRKKHQDIATNGAIGCALSHITLWEMLLKSNEDMFLILEDDVHVNSSKEDINKFLTLVDKYDWDFIYLGYHKKIKNNDYDIMVTDNLFTPLKI